MAVLDLPTIKNPYGLSWDLQPLAPVQENPFNASVQVGEPTELWRGELDYRNLSMAEVRLLATMLRRLRGPAGEFWFSDVTYTRQGNWGGTIVVDGNNQDGTALAIRGATPNQLIAPAGDRFQLGDHLYELMADATANGSGRCTLSFLPDIRVIPTDGTALQTTSPRCKCMLMPDQELPGVTTKRSRLSSYKFKFRESVR